MKVLLLFLSAGFMFCACNQIKQSDVLINTKASIPEHFAISNKKYKVITTFLNRKDSTTSLLYGNEIAYNAAHHHQHSSVPGEVFILVTWKQQPDAHWFGANIPGELRSIETMTTAGNADTSTISYERRTGSALALVSDTTGQNARSNFILAQEASIIP